MPSRGQLSTGRRLRRWGLRIAGLLPLYCGTGWIYIFGFTDYRAHLAPIGIPIGIVTLLIGLALVTTPYGVRWLTTRLRRMLVSPIDVSRGIVIAPCTSVGHTGWLPLRRALWPDASREEHVAEMARFCAAPQRYAQFVAYAAYDDAVGLAEAAIRTDYVNGTDSSPVAFLEGLYVVPAARRKGVARALVAAVEGWAQARRCRELASDAAIANDASYAMHRALGFQETERVVFFRRRLG